MTENTMYIATNGIMLNGAKVTRVTDYNFEMNGDFIDVSLELEIPRKNFVFGGKLPETEEKAGIPYPFSLDLRCIPTERLVEELKTRKEVVGLITDVSSTTLFVSMGKEQKS